MFITPRIDGWTLVVVPLPPGIADGQLGGLSETLGEIQYFVSHRVVEWHEWQRWVGGAPERRYRYIGESGEIQLDDGTPCEAEGDLVRTSMTDDEWEEHELADEDTVMAVAADWSIDPTTLVDRTDVSTAGTVARLTK